MSPTNILRFLVRGHDIRDVNALIHPQDRTYFRPDGWVNPTPDPNENVRSSKKYLYVDGKLTCISNAAPPSVPEPDEPDERYDNRYTIVEYCYGLESKDEDAAHDHMHVVLRLNAIPDPDPTEKQNHIQYIRDIFHFEKYPNIQDIQFGDNFIEAAKYACKCGNYVWPSQVIPEPYDIDEPEWYPCQQEIIDRLRNQTHREILCVVDPHGCTGKTFVVRWHWWRFKASDITISNSYRDVMRFAYDLRKYLHQPLRTIFMDIPRSFPKKDLRQLFSAIESLKDGRLYDDRYKGQEMGIPSPHICIMTNVEPDMNYLTRDRWVIMYVRQDRSYYIPRQKSAWEQEREEEQLRKIERRKEANRRYQRAWREKHKTHTDQSTI